MTRSIAACVDMLVVASVVLAGYLGLNGLVFLANPRSFTFRETHLLRSMTVCCIVALCYLTACWFSTGRTYGSHLMGLRVVTRHGDRLRLWVAFLRAVFYTLVPIGLLWCGWSRRQRSIQDSVLGTQVIYDWHPHQAVQEARAGTTVIH